MSFQLSESLLFSVVESKRKGGEGDFKALQVFADAISSDHPSRGEASFIVYWCLGTTVERRSLRKDTQGGNKGPKKRLLLLIRAATNYTNNTLEF